MALLYGRAGRLTAKNGGFRPGQYASPTPGDAATEPPPPLQADTSHAAAADGPLAGDDAAALQVGPHGPLLVPFTAVLPRECMGQFASFGAT